MLYIHSQNSQGHYNHDTGQLSNVFFNTSRGRALIHLLTVDQMKIGSQNLICIVTPTGHQVRTGSRSADMYFYLPAEPYPGAQRSKRPLHYQQRKPSTLPLHTLPNKSYGIDHYSMSLKFHNPRHRSYSGIIRLLFQFHIIPNFMHARNTLISPIISYAT